MSETARKYTALAFAALGPKNPLRNLSEEDKQLLWAHLKLYAVITEEPGYRELNSGPEERAARRARDAAQLADRLEADVFNGALAEEIQPIFSGFEALPEALRAFANRVGGVLEMAGKPGRMGELSINQLLVMASEFVRLKTGSPYDEHVAELFQGIRTKKGSDFSGDAIHKKRTYLKKNYPALYQNTVQRIKDSFGSARAN
jgi:hypothetical protein